jgi:hypothetical protein
MYKEVFMARFKVLTHISSRDWIKPESNYSSSGMGDASSTAHEFQLLNRGMSMLLIFVY